MTKMAPEWKNKITSPEAVLSKIKPGMTIYTGSGMAEPRTLLKHLAAFSGRNIEDLEIIQLACFGDTVLLEKDSSKRYRLKTCYPGRRAKDAIAAGQADLIPGHSSCIPWVLESGRILPCAVFLQITSPDETGCVNFGIGVEAIRHAMKHASLVVGEISEHMPRTLGDTLTHVDEFDYLVPSTESPVYHPGEESDGVIEKIASNVASLVEDGSCLFFGMGPFFDALGKHLSSTRDLGVHTFFFTDTLKDLVDAGVVTNSRKSFCQGRSLVTSAIGTPALMAWLDNNRHVAFMPLDIVMNPVNIGVNDRFLAIIPAHRVDLAGNIALHLGVDDWTDCLGSVREIFAGVGLSRNGRSIAVLPSRNRKNEPNICRFMSEDPDILTYQGSPDMVVTEHGVAYLSGLTVRERAQALIDIAHPDDRRLLVEEGKMSGILYPDQIFSRESAHLYPEEVSCTHTFENGFKVYFRAIRPSDENNMRRLFYRFSKGGIYSRFHMHVWSMPHEKMQEYVNVDYGKIMSIVGLIQENGVERIIAEARYVRYKNNYYADSSCFVDEAFQRRGVGTFILEMLVRIAMVRGVEGFIAEILAGNRAMARIVFKKSPFPAYADLAYGVYDVTIPFEARGVTGKA